MNLHAALRGTLLGATFLLAGCALKAPYMRYSFDETARLKVESMALLANARQSYRLSSSRADSVMRGIESAYADASLRSKNQASMRQWEILLDSEKVSMAGMVRQWKREDTLSTATILLTRLVVAEDFDIISELEGKKSR
jgi:hypothetical protein